MKVAAYSIKPFEKELLSKANQKKHDITLISNQLSIETTILAGVIERPTYLGVEYIAIRSAGTDHIGREAAGQHGMKVANMPHYSPESIAEHAVALAFVLNQAYLTRETLQGIADQSIKNLDLWQQNKCICKACASAKNCQVPAVSNQI